MRLRCWREPCSDDQFAKLAATMLNALAVCDAGNPAARLRLVRSFEAQGFRLARSVRWLRGDSELEALLWSLPSQASIPDAIVQDPRGFACCVGTVWYKGAFGAAALSRILDDFDGVGSTLDERSLRGSFVALIRNASGTWLFNDPMGFARVYLMHDRTCFSTSWLAARAWSGSGEIDVDAAIEYVLLESVYGEPTVASRVAKLPLGAAVNLGTFEVWRRVHGFEDWLPSEPCMTFDTAVARLTEHYSAVFSEIADSFPGSVNCALSGGFDSRMIVAGVLASGERPNLFVYGATDSTDVVVARDVASALGLEIRVVDKSAADRALPEPDAESLLQSAMFFDGLPNDGLVDPGSDRGTRLLQNARGSIALNGGGGEILRNFFHLPDRRFSAIDLVRTFYRGFDADVFRDPLGLRRYEERLAASIEATLGAQGRMNRCAIELAYPLFRCHHWMGSNNSVELRHGYFATPLVDREAVHIVSGLPLSWKNAGRLQSALINALHQGIACRQSAYGFRFSEGPGIRARASEWLTCARPIAARPWVNAFHRRLRRSGVDPSRLQRWRSVLPGEWRLDGMVNFARLPDHRSFERALSLEIISRMVAT